MAFASLRTQAVSRSLCPTFCGGTLSRCCGGGLEQLHPERKSVTSFQNCDFLLSTMEDHL